MIAELLACNACDRTINSSPLYESNDSKSRRPAPLQNGEGSKSEELSAFFTTFLLK